MLRSFHQCLLVLLLSLGGEPRLLAELPPLDGGFSCNPGGSPVYALALQPDGRIVVAGNFTNFHGVARNRIVRLQPDGSMDPGFSPGNGPNAAIHALALQSDGRILVGGSFTNFNGVPRPYLARLNSDGSLDGSFTPTVDSNVWTMVVQGDGRIVLGGAFVRVNGALMPRVARMNSDGSADQNFVPGAGTYYFPADTVAPSVTALAVDSTGRIYLGGTFTHIDGRPRANLGRLLASGAVDNSFAANANGAVLALKICRDGDLLVGGAFSTIGNASRNRLARLTGNGSHDPAFNPGSAASSHVYCLAEQPDGKILLGGAFSFYDGQVRERVARLDPTGALDPAFDSPSIQGASVVDMELQSDGKLLIGGPFFEVNYEVNGGVARLLNSFDPGANVPSRLVRARHLSPSLLEFFVEASLGRNYRVERSANLSSWDPVTNFNAVTNLWRVTDLPQSGNTPRFYRAVQY